MATAQIGLQATAGGVRKILRMMVLLKRSLVFQTGSSSTENTGYRFAIEFDLSSLYSLPTGATINSAQLSLRTATPDSAGQTTLAGYMGNGSLELSDVTTGAIV